MYLNLGCGPGRLDHSLFIHIDGSRKLLLTKIFPQLMTTFLFRKSSPSEIWDSKVRYKNLVKFQPKADSLQCVYSSHLLEHLYFSDANVLLESIFDGLRPGGLIRICLPDYDMFIDRYIGDRNDSPVNGMLDFERSLLSHPLNRPSSYARFREFVSGQHHVHRWHPTYALTEDMLASAGFSNIKKYKYHESQIPNIEMVETRITDSFYIEASKPKLI